MGATRFQRLIIVLAVLAASSRQEDALHVERKSLTVLSSKRINKNAFLRHLWHEIPRASIAYIDSLQFKTPAIFLHFDVSLCFHVIESNSDSRSLIIYILVASIAQDAFSSINIFSMRDERCRSTPELFVSRTPQISCNIGGFTKFYGGVPDTTFVL